MPHMAWARLLSERGLTETSSLAKDTSTSSGTVKKSSPFAPLIETFWPSTLAVTPFGMATGFFPTRDMMLILRSGGQKTLQSTSPPTLASRAAWSAMTPFGVETMVMPSPLATRGRASTAA